MFLDLTLYLFNIRIQVIDKVKDYVEAGGWGGGGKGWGGVGMGVCGMGGW